MKILLLLSRCDQTGMTTHTLDLGRALVSLGHRVTLLVGGGRKICRNQKYYIKNFWKWVFKLFLFVKRLIILYI